MHITFRPFTRQEFSRYEEWSIGSYAEALICSGTETEKDALCVSAEEFEEMLPDGMDTPDNFFFYADNEYGDNVGFVWYTVVEKGEVFLSDFGVSPEYREQGYGAAILRKLEAELRAQGITLISLHVFDYNKPAIRLYTDMGYEVYTHLEPASTYMKKEI